MSTESQPVLPGFEPPRPGENKLSAAAATQLEKLREANLLTDDHAIISQLVVSLASSVGGSLANGKLSVAGVQGAKLLLEAVELLPQAESNSGMAALVSELRAVS